MQLQNAKCVKLKTIVASGSFNVYSERLKSRLIRFPDNYVASRLVPSILKLNLSYARLFYLNQFFLFEINTVQLSATWGCVTLLWAQILDIISRNLVEISDIHPLKKTYCNFAVLKNKFYLNLKNEEKHQKRSKMAVQFLCSKTWNTFKVPNFF